MVGARFGKLTVVEYVDRSPGKKHRWRCACECGGTAVVQIGNLKNGHTTSCGCAKKIAPAAVITHHRSGTSEYNIWASIIQRCENPKSHAWRLYGGRGITMCERWRNSFEAFSADMGPRPPKMSIDRIDPNGNYEPANCRWISMKEQGNNRREHVFIRIGDRVQTLMQWTEEFGLRYHTIKQRMRALHWSPSRALNLPEGTAERIQ